MASVDLLASSVMDTAASALNDAAKERYTYVVQIPYLNMALRELQEHFELNKIPVTQDVSAVINVPANTSEIGFNGTPPVPELPDDLIEPKLLWEAADGQTLYTPMTRVDILPIVGTTISQFLVYVWEKQKIKLIAANVPIDLKMNYTRQLFTTVTTSADVLNIVNAHTFLGFKTASFIAKFVEENDTRADSLANDAEGGLDRALGIGTQGRQAMMTRRRPFRAGFKSSRY